MQQTAFRRRRVERGVQVDQFAVGQKGLKAVRAALRDHQHPRRLLVQFYRMPCQERGRPGAQVHDHVPYAALDATYQLHFRMGRVLKMHAA
ncbi:hypothetical protein D3C87_1776100 [compost metagenome]